MAKGQGAQTGQPDRPTQPVQMAREVVMTALEGCALPRFMPEGPGRMVPTPDGFWMRQKDFREAIEVVIRAVTEQMPPTQP